MSDQSKAKPVDQVVFEGERAIANVLLGGPGGRADVQGEGTVEGVTRRLAAASPGAQEVDIGLAPTGLPLRAIYGRNGSMVFLVEYPLHARTVPWIHAHSRSAKGPGTKYRSATIALPFVEFFINVVGGKALGNSSVYFRTAPLARADYADDLLDCHFLNCSPNSYGVYCWLCTQHMRHERERNESVLQFVAASIENFWFAAFNLSSEVSEGQSFFGKGSRGKHAIADERVRSIEAWEAASRDDPSFVLGVPWNPAGRTAREVFAELVGKEPAWPFRTATQVSNLILRDSHREQEVW